MQFKKHYIQSNHALVTQLYQQHAPTVLMFLCQQVPSREDAEDVLLEVFQAAAESEVLPTLNISQQRTWLWTTARNKAIDHYRRSHQRPLFSVGLEEAAETLFDESSTPEFLTLRRETYAELRTHVSSLPELQQEILRLRFAHGLKCNEIAQQLNKSHEAIRTMLSRSLNLLRHSYHQNREDQSHG